ncbi:MAG: flagellar hook-basal body complex protein, partial [Thermodesulfobacteriota bacterium]
MGVSTAMWAAITGLDAMGTAMSVISNNIANVNTVGFKAARANFQDLLSQSTHSGSGAVQVGRGVQLGSVTQVFSQGSFQNSTQDTDIAITGDGFFEVVDQVTGEIFYTRAGNFIFDRDGRMMTPGGYVLQGWELSDTIPPTRVGTPTDVVMTQFNAPPEITSLAQYIVNLDSRESSRYNGAPFSNAWDGSDTDRPIDGQNYVYQTSLRIYDGLGDGHDISIYFDPHDTLDNVWDYIVTCNPEEDKRVDSLGRPVSGSSFAGLLMRGTITFSATGPDGNGGEIVDITAENFNINSARAAYVTSASAGWTSGTVTTGGPYTGSTDRVYTIVCTSSGSGAIGSGPPYPQITVSSGATVVGVYNLSSFPGTYTVGSGVTLTFSSASVTSGDTFTLGATAEVRAWTSAVPNSDGYYEFTAAFLTSATPVVPVDQIVSLNFGARNPDGLGTWTLDNQSTTQYAAPSTTLFQTQDGYTSGYLQRISIDPDGVLTGSYSNGRNISVFQIGLAIFRNPWGLEKVGNNLYRATRDSGEGTYNPPGTGGTGTIAPNALEQSNVDLADEFVQMIIQQRGFQANSKVITTTDTMLA